MGLQNSVPVEEDNTSPKPSQLRRNKLKKPPTNTSLDAQSRPVFALARRRQSLPECSPANSEHETSSATETDTVDLATPTRPPPPTTIIEEIAETALSASSPPPAAPGRVLRRRSLLVAAPPGTVTRRGTKASRHSLPAPSLTSETTATATAQRCVTPSGYSVIGTLRRGSLRITNGAASPVPSSAPASPTIPPPEMMAEQNMEPAAACSEETGLSPGSMEATRFHNSSHFPPLHLTGPYQQPHEVSSELPPYAATAPAPQLLLPTRTPSIQPRNSRIQPTKPPTIRHVHDEALDALEGREQPAIMQNVECTITTSTRYNPVTWAAQGMSDPQWQAHPHHHHKGVYAVQQTVITNQDERSVVQQDYAASATHFVVQERRSEQWLAGAYSQTANEWDEVLDNSKITGQEYYRRFSRRRSQGMMRQCRS